MTNAAAQLEAGDTVVLALPGSTLPGGSRAQVSRATVRGVASEGALCSGADLCWSGDGAGRDPAALAALLKMLSRMRTWQRWATRLQLHELNSKHLQKCTGVITPVECKAQKMTPMPLNNKCLILRKQQPQQIRLLKI